MNPGFPGHRGYPDAGLERGRHQPFLLRRIPASPTLNRRDDLNLRLRHLTTPRNSHVTQNLTSDARRPPPEGYPASDPHRKSTISYGGRISISLGPGMGLGQRFTQATASSMSLTSQSQKPATSSRVSA